MSEVWLTEDDQLFDWQLGFGHGGAVVSGRMLCSNPTSPTNEAKKGEAEELSARADVRVLYMAVDLLLMMAVGGDPPRKRRWVMRERERQLASCAVSRPCTLLFRTPKVAFTKYAR